MQLSVCILRKLNDLPVGEELPKHWSRLDLLAAGVLLLGKVWSYQASKSYTEKKQASLSDPPECKRKQACVFEDILPQRNNDMQRYKRKDHVSKNACTNVSFARGMLINATASN